MHLPSKAGDTAFGRRRPSTAGLLGVGLLLLLAISVALIASETPVRGFLIAAIALAILFPLIARLSSRPFDIFEPIVPATAALFFMFVVRPIADQWQSNYVHLGFNISAEFDQTLFTALVGCVAFSVGYVSNTGKSVQRLFPRVASEFPLRKVVPAAIITAVIGASLWSIFLLFHGGLSMLLLILKGRSEELRHILRNSTGYLYRGLDLLVPAAFMLQAAWLRFRRPHLLVLTTITLIPTLVMSAATGTRSALLPIVFGLAAIYYLHSRRRPKLRNLALLGVIFLLASSFLRDVRYAHSIGRRSLVSSEFVDDPGESVADTFARDDDEMFDTLANTLSVVPSRIPYQPLGVVTDLCIRALPRTLYPNKPLEANTQFLDTLWPLDSEHARAAAANSILGNFYLYGGVVGVAIGAFCIGILFNQTWRWYLRNLGKMDAILLYAFVPGFVVILLRGTITDTLTRMLFFVFPIFVAQRYWRQR